MNVAGPQSAQLPRPGDIVGGKYVLENLLGQGGMGAVFKARHRKLGHEVAIKVMLADSSNQEAATRFINEGKAAANIQSDHVVRVSDVDEELGYAYMVLEFLEGEDIAQVLERERRLPPPVAVDYVLQALQGVAQAHAQGIVHRDLKPSNLYLARRRDGTVIVKVLDFGISKASATSPLNQSPNALTSTKAMLGSPLYMSPEQLRSSKSVDQRADIWAVGVILYELLTGTLPFSGDNLGELFAAILETDPPSIRALVPEVRPELEAIVLRCLARRPEQRFQSAGELMAALAPFAQRSSTGGPAYAGLGSFAPVPSRPSFGGMTPPAGSQSQPGQRGAITGSGPRSVPLAAVAPPGVAGVGAQTSNAWQTSDGLQRPTSSNAKIIAVMGVFCALALAGIALFTVTWRANHAKLAAEAAASVEAPVTSPDPPPVPSPIPVPAEPATVTTTTTAVAPAATTAAAHPAAQPSTASTGAKAAVAPRPTAAATSAKAAATPPPTATSTAQSAPPAPAKPKAGAPVLTRD